MGRLSILSVLLSGLAFSMVAQVAVNAYRSYKESMLGSFQQQKTEVIEARLRAYLMERTNAVVYERTKLPFSLDEFGTKKLPRGQELVVGFVKGQAAVMGVHIGTQVWVRQLGQLETFWEGGEDFTYVTTRTGALVASNKSFVSNANQENALAKADAFQRGLGEAGYRFVRNSAFENSLVAFMPVAGTNLTIFAETSVAGYLQILRSFSVGMFSALLFVAYFAYMAAVFLSMRFQGTLGALVSVLDKLEAGKEVIPVDTSLHEVEILQARLLELGKHLRARSCELQWNENAKVAFFDAVSVLSSSFTRRELFYGFAKATFTMLSDESPSLSLVLYTIGERNVTGKSEMRKVFLMLSGILVAEPQFREVLNEGWDVADSQEFAAHGAAELVSEREVRFPVCYGNQAIGFLLCTGQGMSELSRTKLEWISLLCDALSMGFVLVPVGKRDQERLSA